MSKRSALSRPFQGGLPTVNAASLVAWDPINNMGSNESKHRCSRDLGGQTRQEKSHQVRPWRLFPSCSSSEWKAVCCFRVITDANIWLPGQWFQALARDASRDG